MAKFPNMKRIKCIHFVGVGGSGMSGIAEVLLNKGYKITGSDISENHTIEYLQEMGVQFFLGHHAANVANADIVVVSTAIAKDNPEVVAAHKKHIPVLRRAEMLGELMRLQYGIAVAGTHGKTTTTSLIASVLSEADLDPTFVIGGILNSAGTHAQLGDSEFFVAEADESDASFLYLHPKIAVVTNIDADHMQTYKDDMAELRQAFLDFLHRLPLDGLAILCIDDPIIREMLPDIARPIITYGFSKDADIQASGFKQIGLKSTFVVTRKADDKKFPVVLNLPGRHNVLNALATIATAFECNVSEGTMNCSLSKFQGVGRRSQIHGEFNLTQGHITLIDDYGHHPREIDVTLEAMRDAWPKRRLVLVFQPHRYTRTQSLFDDFATVLAKADKLVLLDIYPANEKPIPGVSGEVLINAVKQKGAVDPVFIEDIADLPFALEGLMQDGDVLLLQGAGSIGISALKLKKRFTEACT